jgi:hypothetical protein
VVNEARRNPDKAAQHIAGLTYNLAIFGATAVSEIARLDPRGGDPIGWVNRVSSEVSRARR